MEFGSETATKAAEHLAFFGASVEQRGNLTGFCVIQELGEQEMGFGLRQRALSNRNVPQKVFGRVLGMSLGEICGNGDGRTLQLAAQTVHLELRKPLREQVDFLGQLHAQLPDLQLTIAVHQHRELPSEAWRSDRKKVLSPLRTKPIATVVLALKSVNTQIRLKYARTCPSGIRLPRSSACHRSCER